MKIFGIKITKKFEAIVWSYVGGAVTADGFYTIGYIRRAVIDGQVDRWNWGLFGWLALAGFLAPLFKAVNPWFKEFGLLDILKPFESKAVAVAGSHIAGSGVDVKGVTDQGSAPKP